MVEERIVGEELLSPSVQLRSLPDGTVELLSTHDQLLGGGGADELGKGLYVRQQMFYASLSLNLYRRDPAGIDPVAVSALRRARMSGSTSSG